VIEIDGGVHSGSGTLLRYAAALATVTHEPLHMFRIRAKREKPGLRPQHLQAVRACSAMCAGRLEGDEVGSQEIFFWPGKELKGGAFRWDIGTAGSATMLAFALLPPALFSIAPCQVEITGGLFQDFAPTVFHMQRVLIPTIRKMGARVKMEMIRPGYVPLGQGQLRMSTNPLKRPLRALTRTTAGGLKQIYGTSLASHLREEKVSERMAERSRELLEKRGYEPRIEAVHDQSAVQKGAALLLWVETETGCLLGADRAGKRGRSSESIAEFAVRSLLEDVESGATVDRHLADQLILFAALADGLTEYVIPMVTDHIESNLWLVSKVLGVRPKLEGGHLSLEGIGLGPAVG